jgi:AcrR family transcriptional regulator
VKARSPNKPATPAVERRREYRSPGRAEQARRTQERILQAARALFLEDGFAATTIAAVAANAGVAPETVYAAYRSKAGLLEGVVMGAITRDGEPEEVLERRWVTALLRLPDLRTRLGAFSRHTAETLELTSPIYAIMRAAGTGTQELHRVDGELRAMRFRDQGKVMSAIAGDHPLRHGSTVARGAETFSALASPELHHVLRVERGWSRRRYAAWLEETVAAAIAPE